MKAVAFQQKLLEKAILLCQYDRSGRPVLTSGKHPKYYGNHIHWIEIYLSTRQRYLPFNNWALPSHPSSLYLLVWVKLQLWSNLRSISRIFRVFILFLMMSLMSPTSFFLRFGQASTQSTWD